MAAEVGEGEVAEGGAGTWRTSARCWVDKRFAVLLRMGVDSNIQIADNCECGYVIGGNNVGYDISNGQR